MIPLFNLYYCLLQSRVSQTGHRRAQDLKEWLAWLRRDVGFDGWRFDFAKGYRGERVREYVEATQPDIAVGEFWDACGYEGEHGDQLCANQVDPHCCRVPLQHFL